MKFGCLTLLIALMLLFSVSCDKESKKNEQTPKTPDTTVEENVTVPEQNEGKVIEQEESSGQPEVNEDVEVEQDTVTEDEPEQEISTETFEPQPSVEVETQQTDAPVVDTPIVSAKEDKPAVVPDEPKTEPEVIPDTPALEEKQPLDHNKYWALQAAYGDAVKTSDIEDDVKAGEAILSLYRDLEDLNSCKRVIVPLLRLSKIYEERGQFADALRCYEMYRDAYKYIDANTDENCTEPLKYAEAFINHYSHIEPEVYTVATKPRDVPYFGSILEPEVGTYSGMCGLCDRDLSNAQSLYVQFGTETASDFAYKLPKDEEFCMLEVAWNTSEHTIEHFKDIATGKYDDYIIETLTWLESLKTCGVLLRFAAEVNEWEVNTTYAKNGQLEEFKTQYIEAFRRISTLRNTHAPDIALVYSPNDISNMYVTHLDFYPGDKYVDWVGLSSYMNISTNSTNAWGSMTDAYYSRGKYENQILKIKPILDDFGTRKPIIISECGFSYESTKTPQTQEHAEKMMRFFYSYINMVYPQVKAIYYFNTNFNGNHYQLFDEEKHSVNHASEVYEESIHSNVPIETLREGHAEGYTHLTTLNEVRDSLTLAVFVSYPGNPTTTVTYKWDGVKIAETTTIPYQATINKDKLTVGTHTLTVTTTCKLTTFTKNYTVTVTSDGNVSAK